MSKWESVLENFVTKFLKMDDILGRNLHLGALKEIKKSKPHRIC